MRVHALYFSATLTTKRVVEAIASATASALSVTSFDTHDVTTPSAREKQLEFSADDIVIFGTPVYIGRVPNLIKPYLETICGGGATGIPVVVYGNRHFDDALVELYDLMTNGGFRCIAGAAFIGEHSFSRKLGEGRPDAADMEVASEFGEKIAQIVRNSAGASPQRPDIPGSRPYRFFKAVDDEGKPFDIRKVKPVTDSGKCNKCGVCVRICPMGAIDPQDQSLVPGICIKCGACVKRCPTGAKSFADKEYLRHLAILERDHISRKEPELFF